jgi:hypothetical protein
MKKVFYLCLIGLLTVFQRCSTEEPALESGNEKVQFTVAIPSQSESGGRMKEDLPDGVSVLISINNSSGSPIATLQRIDLLKIGEGYITEPIELKPGNYSIVDFLIVKDSEVLFATPKHGSPLAPAVARSLPSDFSVGRNSVSNIDMQVVSTKQKDPESFGYVSFSVDVMSPLLISVLLIENETVSFTTAQADIYDGENLIRTYSLGAKINTIGFSEDPDKTYSLVIHKQGYGHFQRQFTYNQLVQELDGKPLKVILDPTLELEIASVYGDDEPFELSIAGQGQITLNGPGELNGTYKLPMEIRDVLLPHGNYLLEIKGDLDQITSFESFGYNTGITKMTGLQHMIALKGLRPGMYLNNELDLRQNEKLTGLEIHIHNTDHILLPETHAIKNFVIITSPNITTPQLDKMVGNIYRNAVEKSIFNGVMEFNTSNSPPPSAETLSKMISLRDEYGWSVFMSDYEF